MNDIKTTTPGYARTAVAEPVSLQELPWCGKINLRGNPQNKQFMDAVFSEIGMTLPLEPNSNASQGDFTCFWLGPNEWQLHFPIATLSTQMDQLKSQLQGIHSAVVDVSDYYTILRISGEGSREILMKACPLDLHPSQFSEGSSSQTRFGHASILLHQTDSIPSYNVQVRWSYAEYVWDYFVSGMTAL